MRHLAERRPMERLPDVLDRGLLDARLLATADLRAVGLRRAARSGGFDSSARFDRAGGIGTEPSFRTLPKARSCVIAVTHARTWMRCVSSVRSASSKDATSSVWPKPSASEMSSYQPSR